MNQSGRCNTWQLTAFGIRVKKKMAEKNMTMLELAREVGMSASFLSQVLYGKRKGNQYIGIIKKTMGIKDKQKDIG